MIKKAVSATALSFAILKSCSSDSHSSSCITQAGLPPDRLSVKAFILCTSNFIKIMLLYLQYPTSDWDIIFLSDKDQIFYEAYINTPFFASIIGGNSVSPSISRKSISIPRQSDSMGISVAIP